MTPFVKMHGLGNDFAVFDARRHALALDAKLARSLADRRSGIGCDQVIVLEPAKNGADIFMRIFNADGGEVENCGNAARCAAIFMKQATGIADIRLETLGGLLSCVQRDDATVTVDMGEPGLGWRDIPLAQAMDTNRFSLEFVGDLGLEAAAVSVGNPHCVLFFDSAEDAPVAELGPRFEHHPLFPSRTNVEFVSVEDRTHLRMRVWERGVGITRACGTGACASAVAAYRRGLVERKIDVLLDGGTLEIEWRESDGHVLMTGPATLSYRGEIDLEAFA